MRLPMLTIDGSFGEGGGQLVRNAVGLSALTGIPVAISRIRAGRKRPGLFPQHIAAVWAIACSCDATVTGLEQGSSVVTFTPGKPKPCDVSVTIGTAGSIPLIILAWLPVALITGGNLHVTGGTEVPLSPTIDYFDNVFCSVLRKSGAEIHLNIERRGYYPAGGGAVTVLVEQRNISPIRTDEQCSGPCHIASCSSNLPAHVADRQAVAAARHVERETGLTCENVIDARAGPGTGSSCTIWRGAKGGSELGRRGFPAENVGESAARVVIDAFRAPGTVDVHIADQLLVPLALFGGKFTTAALTTHAEATVWLLEQFGYKIQSTCGAGVEFSA